MILSRRKKGKPENNLIGGDRYEEILENLVRIRTQIRYEHQNVLIMRKIVRTMRYALYFFCLFIITDIYLYFILRYSQIYNPSYIIISVYQLNCFDKNKTGLTPRHYYQLAITYYALSFSGG